MRPSYREDSEAEPKVILWEGIWLQGSEILGYPRPLSALQETKTVFFKSPKGSSSSLQVLQGTEATGPRIHFSESICQVGIMPLSTVEEGQSRGRSQSIVYCKSNVVGALVLKQLGWESGKLPTFPKVSWVVQWLRAWAPMARVQSLGSTTSTLVTLGFCK